MGGNIRSDKIFRELIFLKAVTIDNYFFMNLHHIHKKVMKWQFKKQSLFNYVKN